MRKGIRNGVKSARTDIDAELEALRERVTFLEAGEAHRKELEVQLQESEHRFRLLLDVSQHAVCVYDAQLKIVHVNEEFTKLLGYARDSVVGKSLSSLTAPAQWESVRKEFSKKRKGAQVSPVNMGWLHKNRDVLDSFTACVPILDAKGDFSGAFAVIANVTPRETRHDSFFQEQHLLRTLMDSLPDFVYVKDVQSRFITTNSAHMRLLGVTELSELVGKTDFDFFPLELAEQYYANEQDVMASGNPLLNKIEQTIDQDGNEQWLLTFKAPLRDSSGGVVGLVGISRDITELRRAERALREGEERFRLILENSRDVAFKLNLESKQYEYISPSITHICGYSPEELIQMGPEGLMDIVHPEDRPALTEYRKRGTQRGFTGPASHVIEYRLRHRNGQYRWAAKSSAFVRTGDKRVLAEIGTVRDITERKLAEQALHAASRMEATATLAGGIAHTFNNLMVGVLGNAELLQMHFQDDQRAIRMLSTIAKSARQAGELAQHLLSFSRGGKCDPGMINLNDSIHETLRIEERLFPPTIEVEQNLDQDLWNVMADPVQVTQIIINLASNAVESIQGSGRVRIMTRNLEVDEALAQKEPGLKPGRYISFAVEDTGCGMNAETIERIFEPFFTTKVQGRGLGLSAVYGIVKNHGGHINVVSQEGVGTCFTVYLAAADQRIDRQESAAVAPLAPPTGKETVLLVDDEQIVLSVTQQVLKRLGYKVLSARNGQEALDIAKSYDGEIHVALLDMGMPIMSGVQAFPLLKSMRPNIKVVLTSGYELDSSGQALLSAGANAFIQKPFPTNVLATEIRAALDAE